MDRPRLAQRVLGDEAAMKRLEAIVHPMVDADRRTFLADARARGVPFVVLDVPLLFEIGFERYVDLVLVVAAEKSVQKSRVLARPGMTLQRFEAIVAKQVPDANKRKRAHIVIDSGRGIAFARYKNYAALTAVAMEIRVSPRNGQVQVLRVSVADDSGQVINPNGLANQMEGAVIQSLSWTLKEEVKFSDSAILSTDWASYPILTFQEVPKIDVALINQPGMPFLGTGEAGQGPTAAALANAIYDAVGIRLYTLPFTPDRVKTAMNAKK